MSSKFDAYQKRRLLSSYLSVVVSIALVLFMVGILGLVLLKSTFVANKVKEKVAITLFLKDNVSTKNRNSFKDSLLEEEFTRTIIYTSKEKAAKIYSEEIGEDFLEFLGENPLKNGIDIYLKADYVTPEKMQELETRFLKNAFVSDVSYDKPLINLLTKNIKRISFWLLVVCGFFGLIAMILINSSIRLSIYSKRFNIKTMQMVGATKGFIRRPFIWQSIKLGIFGALLALVALGVIIYYADQLAPSLHLVKDYVTLGYLVGGVLISAFLITWISTYFATQRFLNLQTDELYY
ncbi:MULTISPECIES: ABC transporter permease [unclassified Polaribacter]|jgi:cell division transport system permease protein|uniref:cell division protein FtsX n=1 Tax=unclassified Polaribacter TaxID=196858 RepID=UPI001C4E351E|nr:MULTISPECIES: permease-like cell division protein FtsX [unclassified Polaribacter]QXP63396.1 ABC transporter permease [Polaribacter sp. HaHaR_3_91]QXP65903.1 ABC transporter permease [Polaribacter sp. AHE13PA]QXP71389.1 ABC transporter permease [Polaribacter sp. R2A056_3_33]